MFSDYLNVNNINQPLPMMKLGCYGVAFFLAGRKVSQFLASGAYKAGSRVAGYMNHKEFAESFQKASTEYLSAARKNLVRDLTLSVGFGVAGFAVDYALNMTKAPSIDENLRDELDYTSTSLTHENLANASNVTPLIQSIAIESLTSNGEASVGGFNGENQDWQGIKTLYEGIYSGEFKDNMANGHGTLTWKDGRTYVGEFKDGELDGQGALTAIGGTYVGGFKGGERNGLGIMTWKGDSTYDGAKYMGEFKDDMVNGYGTLTWKDGRTYVGEFKANKRDGQGTLTCKDGRMYIGEFKDDKYDGQGTFIADNLKYVGEFKDNMVNGRGTLTVNGIKYVGEFKDDKWDGRGVFRMKDGTELAVESKAGKIVFPRYFSSGL